MRTLKRILYAFLFCLLLITGQSGYNTCSAKTVSNNSILSIGSVPSGAEIWIDGTDTGIATPCHKMSISQGNHIVKLVIPGYDVWEQNVNTADNKSITVSGVMQITIPQGKVIVVDSVQDTTNGDCTSIDSMIANPGNDGITLREAITAANNTTGYKTIEFSHKLKGLKIVVGSDTQLPLPSLTGGEITINGDIDHDGMSQ